MIAIQGVGHSNERRKNSTVLCAVFFDNVFDGMLFLLQILSATRVSQRSEAEILCLYMFA